MSPKKLICKVLLAILPLVILLVSLTFDWLEPVISKYFFWQYYDPFLLLWLLSLIRVVFVLVIFAGVLFFIKSKHRTKSYSVLWLVLGMLSVLVSTPLGRHITTFFIRAAFFQPYPKDLFFLAGATLLVTGVYGLINPVKNRQDLE